MIAQPKPVPRADLVDHPGNFPDVLVVVIDRNRQFGMLPLDMAGEQILECFDGADKLSGQKAEEVYKKLFVWEEEK